MNVARSDFQLGGRPSVKMRVDQETTPLFKELEMEEIQVSRLVCSFLSNAMLREFKCYRAKDGDCCEVQRTETWVAWICASISKSVKYLTREEKRDHLQNLYSDTYGAKVTVSSIGLLRSCKLQ